MREILFRGKRVSNGEWVEGRLFGDEAIVPKGQPFLINENHLELIEDIECFEVEADTVGQYTGLTDKNGKKIFEGDIVKIYSGNMQWGKNRTVVFEDGQWLYMCSLEISKSYISAFGNSIVEVIGNIHDNPELLGDANV